MSNRTKLIYKIIFGSVIIGGTIFLSFRYLLKGSPFIKVMALGLVVAVTFLVFNYIKKTTNN
jgi:hypothetical protein